MFKVSSDQNLSYSMKGQFSWFFWTQKSYKLGIGKAVNGFICKIYLAGILIIKLTKRRFINMNRIGSVRLCPDDLFRRGAGRGQYYY